MCHWPAGDAAPLSGLWVPGNRIVSNGPLPLNIGGEWYPRGSAECGDSIGCRGPTFPVLSQNLIEPRSGRSPMIEFQRAAESLVAPHSAVLIRRFRRSHEQYIPRALVVPFAMVVGEVLTDGPA